MKSRIILCIMLLSSSCSFAKELTFDIDKLIKIALHNSPDIKISQLNFDASKARERFAIGYYYPHIDVSAQGGKEWSKLKKEPFGDIDIISGKISASQLLYDFGKQQSIVHSHTQEALAYKAQMYQTISQKILQVKQVYYEILKAKGIEEAKRKNLQLQKHQLYRAKKYLKAGIRTIIDVSDAKIRLQQAKRDLINAKYNTKTLYAQLEQILGQKPSTQAYSVYVPKFSTKKLSYKIPIIKEPLYKLEEFAYKHRYILKGASHIIKQSKANLSATHKEYYPTISLNADYSNQHIDSKVLTTMPQEQSHITLNMNLNLFNGYQTHSKEEEAKVNMLKAYAQEKSIRLAIKQEVVNAYISLKMSKENIALNEQILQTAKQKFQQAQKRYENGLNDFIELQNAQQDYIDALITLNNSYYDYFISLAMLDYAIGR